MILFHKTVSNRVFSESSHTFSYHSFKKRINIAERYSLSMSHLCCNSFVIYNDNITKEVSVMSRSDDMQLAFALYDSLTPEERSIVMEILRSLALPQAQSDAAQQTDAKTTE